MVWRNAMVSDTILQYYAMHSSINYNYSLQDISAGKECKMVTNYKGGENQSTVVLVGYHNGVSKFLLCQLKWNDMVSTFINGFFN